MKDRLKIYLVIVSILFIAIHITSEHLAKTVDEEVEIFNHHVSIFFNAHKIIYHITAIQGGVYSLEYGSFKDADQIKSHLKELERGIEGLSEGISFIYLNGMDDEEFRQYAQNTEAIKNLYPKYITHVNAVLAEDDVKLRQKQIEEVAEIGERMGYFIRELDNYMDVQHTEISAFLPTITDKMRFIRNVSGIFLWGAIVILSIVYFYSCKPLFRLLPYLSAIRNGEYDFKPELDNTRCENEIESTLKAVISRINDSEKSSSALSILDPLTGAYNRRYFDMRISEEMSRYSRHGTIFSLSIIDIDFFKKINDTLGHQAGDLVLREMVAVIRNNVRETDIVTRYGGEEFAVLSPYTPKSGVLTLVERLRGVVEGYKFSGLDHSLTISIGIADSAGKRTAEHIIEDADASLYIAKNSGRNKCVVAGAAA
ncbi:MAG: GGDEF domain-containing protein [Nitrospirae bacterium]|nr:GGDEF domain-containing protein [Nitrospirota bacterium]